MPIPRLHVNVDHVATLRQARREPFPDPVEWALAAERAGEHGITCHLRKDRRLVQDADIHRLRGAVTTLLNLEVSLDPEMLGLAVGSGAEAFCVVPENRLEITTEGGLDVIRETPRLKDAVPRLTEAGGAVSIFIDPDPANLDAAAALGAPFVELTGAYANASGPVREAELARLAGATARALHRPAGQRRARPRLRERRRGGRHRASRSSTSASPWSRARSSTASRAP